MLQPISTSLEVSSTTFQPSVSSLHNKDLQYGASTLTLGSAAKNSVIVLVILGIGALLVVLWRKLFAARFVPVPSEIQEWVKQNCQDLNTCHQVKASKVIASIKGKREHTANRDVNESLEAFFSDSSCGQCTKIKARVIRYFEIHPVAPPPPVDVAAEAEIRGFMKKKWPDLAEDVARQVIERIHVFERDPVFQANPTKEIGAIRLNRMPSDDVALKASVYLSDKYRFLKKRH